MYKHLFELRAPVLNNRLAEIVLQIYVISIIFHKKNVILIRKFVPLGPFYLYGKSAFI